jgi:acyl-homoserine lactone acylase PvdQ
MLLFRSIAQGKLSENFASDETSLKIDTFMRKVGFHHTAKKMMKNIDTSAAWIKLVEEYSLGVNKYLEVATDICTLTVQGKQEQFAI